MKKEMEKTKIDFYKISSTKQVKTMYENNGEQRPIRLRVLDHLNENEYKELDAAFATGDVTAVQKLFDEDKREVNFSTRGLNLAIERYNDIALARCFLDNGAFPDTRLVATPAVESGNLDLVKLLVEYGWDIRSEAHKLYFYAAKYPSILLYLLDLGAPLDRGPPRRNENAKPGEKGFDRNPGGLLNWIAVVGTPELFDEVFERGAPINEATPLHHAATAGRIDMLEHLIQPKFGLDINKSDRSQMGYMARYTPLSNVIWDRLGENTIPWLLDHGAKLETDEIDILRLVKSEGSDRARAFLGIGPREPWEGRLGFIKHEWVIEK